MKRVIITGATSMLGIATVKACVQNGIYVLAVSRPGSKRERYLPGSELVSYYECDLAKLDSLKTDGKYDCCYHFGWAYTDRSTRDDPYLQLKNIDYTLKAVELAHRSGCEKFIGAGSQAEYGFCDKIIDERTSVNPETSYGVAKYAAGKLAKKICDAYGITCIWTRTFSVYGINDSENVMVSYAIRQFFHHEKAIFSPGLQYWDYLFEDDAGMYFYLLGKSNTDSCVVNIASGDSKPLKMFIEDMAEVLGNDFWYELMENRQEKALGIQPDVHVLRCMTGYTPQVSFRDGIKAVYEEYVRRHGKLSV